MHFYMILVALSIAMIGLVSIAIKKMFFRWKVEEANVITIHDTPAADNPRPAVGMMISMDKCLMKKKICRNLSIYDLEKTDEDALELNLKGSPITTPDMSEIEVEKIEVENVEVKSD